MRIASVLVVLGLVATLDATTGGAKAAPLSRPLLPIMFVTNLEGTRYPGYTQSELQQMAQQSVAVWGSAKELPKDDGAVTDLSYLRSQNPDYIVVPYLNAGNQGWKQAGGAELEDDRLNLIQMYRATSLVASIGSSDTQLRVQDSSKIAVTGGAVDPLTALRSLDGSTGPDGGFISFIRIDNEIMRVTQTAQSPPTLTVIRGTDGTTTVAHASGAQVLAPVFVSDFNPDGVSALAKGYVKYSLNVGTPELAAFLVREFILAYLGQGWDGAWLDITAPSFFNMVDARNGAIDGITRAPFNTVDWQDYNLWTRARHHDLKLGRMQRYVLAATGRVPFLAANNNGLGKWFPDKGYGRRFVETTQVKVQPIDADTMEAVFTGASDAPTDHPFLDETLWRKQVLMIADATNNGLGVIPWIKFNVNTIIPENADPAIQAYNWASILLAWGASPGASKVVIELWKAKTGAPNGRELNLPAVLYYDLGRPIGHAPDTDSALDALRIGPSTYKRTWTQGITIVNPTNNQDSGFTITGFVNPDTCLPTPVTSMPPHSYRILQLPQYCG